MLSDTRERNQIRLDPGPTASPYQGQMPGSTPQGLGGPSGPLPPTPPHEAQSATPWIVAALAVLLVVVGGLVGLLLLRDSGETTTEAEAPPPAEVDVPEEPAAAIPPAPEEEPTTEALPPAPLDEGKPERGSEDATVAAAAAGVDFSWLALASASPYTTYEWVTDDSGQLTVEIPTAWADRDLRNDTSDGVAIPSIWAAPDLEGLIDRWDGAGAILELRTAATGTTDTVLADMGGAIAADTTCTEQRSYAYDDGWYVGTAVLYAGCGSTDSAMLQVAATDGTNGILAVQVQMVSTADVDAAVRIVQTFQAITTTTPAPVPVPAPAAPAPVPNAPVAPAPAPAPNPPVNSFGLPTGLFCRDLADMGYSYADAMDYWYADGAPDRMDADVDGIPCETVYPSWEIDAYWGFTTPAPPTDEWAEAMWVAENAMYACGYTPALDTFVDGPFPDGGYTVTMNVDVGWDLIWAQFEVFPWSGEIYGFDAVADDLLWCNY